MGLCVFRSNLKVCEGGRNQDPPFVAWLFPSSGIWQAFCDLLVFYVFLSVQHASSDVERMILGNKCDMNEKRQVSKEKGEKVSLAHLKALWAGSLVFQMAFIPPSQLKEAEVLLWCLFILELEWDFLHHIVHNIQQYRSPGHLSKYRSSSLEGVIRLGCFMKIAG